MAKWKLVAEKKVNPRSLKTQHGTNPKHHSRTRGPIDVTETFWGGHKILDGHHRRADAIRAGKGKVAIRVWKNVGFW